jgi:hypothetical protein
MVILPLLSLAADGLWLALIAIRWAEVWRPMNYVVEADESAPSRR